MLTGLLLAATLSLTGAAPDPQEVTDAVTSPATASDVRLDSSIQLVDSAPQPIRGVGKIPLAVIQYGAGMATCIGLNCALAVPVNLVVSLLVAPVLVPIAGSAVLASALLAPVGLVTQLGIAAGISGVEVFIGDLLGKQRGAFFLPVLAGVAFAGVTGVASLGLSITSNLLAPQQNPAGSPADAIDPTAAFTGRSGAALGVGLLACGVSTAACFALPAVPAITYLMTAEDRRPGDEGGGFPGLMKPNHKVPAATPSPGGVASLGPGADRFLF